MGLLDSRLIALADCAVIPIPPENADNEKSSGGIKFDPHPVIVASSDIVLGHEICHRLAGKRDYAIFNTACIAKQCALFDYTLNLLYDWYHECKYENYSPFLHSQIAELHEKVKKMHIPPVVLEIPELNYLIDLYTSRRETPEEAGIDNCHTLVYLADKISTRIKKRLSDSAIQILQAGLAKFTYRLAKNRLAGAGGSNYVLPKWSNYYAQTTAKYWSTIQYLRDLWIKNKYDWSHKHYGEIDWKRLVKVFVGEKLQWPVFRVLEKLVLFKHIYLVIDRSGSTYFIRDEIMDIAIIIAESLRQCDTPLSILDVGVEDRMINNIDQNIDTNWFTPMSDGGTPMGEVCSSIDEKSPDSLLLIVTDGIPDSFKHLKSALYNFPGAHVTFVIGDPADSLMYNAQIGDSLYVEPHTLLDDLQHYIQHGGLV
jgi:hypothetical protein